MDVSSIRFDRSLLPTRQLEILQMARRGTSFQDITTLLGMSENTLRWCVSFVRPYTGIVLNVAGTVSALDRQGPTATVGILPSDRILSINNEPLNPDQTFYEGVKIGDAVTYTVLRGTETFSYTITAISTPLYAIANRLVITALGWIFWCFGCFLYTRNHPKFSPVHFVIFAVSVAAALFALDDADTGYPWARYTMYCALSINGAAWLNVHRNFPTSVSRKWQLLCDVSYLLAIVVTLLTLGVGPLALTQIGVSFGYSPQLPSNLIRVLWAVECVLGLCLLMQGYRVQSGDSRRRVRFVTIGGLIGLTPIAVMFTAEALNFYVIPNTVALLGLIALPVTYSISLTSTDIIRLETRFYRTLIAGSLVILVPVMYLCAVSFINWILPGTGANPLIGALVALLLTATYSRVHTEVELLFRRIFFSEKPNHFKQLAVITNTLKTLSSQLDKATVVGLLTRQIPTEINVAKAGLWFVEHDRLVWEGGEITQLPDMVVDKSVFDFQEMALLEPRLLQSQEFLVEDVRWWIPLTTSERGEGKEFHGLWLLGQRENDESFSPGDIELINAAAQECALAVKTIHSLAKLRRQLRQTESAWRRTIHIREEEQQRIANDLHDDVIQLVFTCGVKIQAVVRELTSPSERNDTVKILRDTAQLLTEIGEKTRLICYNLRPDALTNLDFVSMLFFLIEETESRSALEITLCVSPGSRMYVDQLEPHTKINLYRIVQEALNNATKHANAAHAMINVSVTDTDLRIEVTDNGKGFDLSTSLPGQQGGLGFATMHTRASDINAQVGIESAIGEGTKVEIAVPFPNDTVATLATELSMA